jgi:hypothetical protein
MSRRREPRVEVNFEVKVWGMDCHGKPFMQHAHTLDITRAGARLIGVDCVKVGEIIGIQNGNHKARFKVVWMGRENTPKAGQVGVHCMEPAKSIFVTHQQHAATEPDLLGQLGPQLGFESVKNARPVKKDLAAVRRKHPRYPCTGGVELRQQESGPPAWGNISDISLTGCYVETVSTLPMGSMVIFNLRTHDLQIKGRAVVKTSHHSVGMGIAFLQLSQEDQQNLEFLIGMLAGVQEMLPEEKRTFVEADAPQEPAQRPAPKPEAAESNGVSARITQSMNQLGELEQQLVKEKIDPRLVAEFHEAMEHARQTASTIQHWVDLHSSGGDPFAVLPELETERINMLMKLARNVLGDIESSGLTEFGEGIHALYTSVQQLHKRLARVFQDAPEDPGNSKTFTRRG